MEWITAGPVFDLSRHGYVQLVSILIGRSRRIPVVALREYVQKMTAAPQPLPGSYRRQTYGLGRLLDGTRNTPLSSAAVEPLGGSQVPKGSSPRQVVRTLRRWCGPWAAEGGIAWPAMVGR